MKLIYFLLVTTLLGIYQALAQLAPTIKAKAEYGSEVKDVQLLMELDHIDYYSTTFIHKNVKNAYALFTTKEYWYGVLVKKDTLLPSLNPKEYLKFNNTNSTSKISLVTKPAKDSISFHFNLLGITFSKKYKRMNNDEYSLRDGLVTNEEFKTIATNTTLPLFVYSLPYEDPKQPNFKFYCALTADGVPPDKWWDTYKIAHYIIVEMKIISN